MTSGVERNSPTRPLMLERDSQIGASKERASPFGPFDDHEARLAPDIAIAEALEGARARLEPIKVEVMHGAAQRFVGLDERERRHVARRA